MSKVDNAIDCKDNRRFIGIVRAMMASASALKKNRRRCDLISDNNRRKINCRSITLITFMLAGCEPTDQPKTAAERACALNSMAKLRGVEVKSTAVHDIDKSEVAKNVLMSMRDYDDVMRLSIDFGYFENDEDRRLRLKFPSSKSDYTEILLDKIVPNIIESKLVVMKIDQGNVTGFIEADCAVSQGGTVRTAIRSGLR